ncbi:MAG: pancreas/duodenum homeobox protein 1 [Dissulfurimicrobium sp.]|uniref:pancreas/duodenum homeobox protein 1 n=1 Tax=Dissulfurimicrobium sp. TaxID=2022436 RepID=UPI0040490ED8
MDKKDVIRQIISDEFLEELFPKGRADEFFEAIYGGAEEGAFDIALRFGGFDEKRHELSLEYRLTERHGKCMTCSLTRGLPFVFERHPIIDINGLVRKIDEKLGTDWEVLEWTLGATVPIAPKVNVIPLRIKLKQRN